MFSRVFPSWEQIEQFQQPLTEGERHLLKFLDENLKKDNSFLQNDDLTKYNGWLIFVQAFLNGSRPDIVIFYPNVGVQIFEVKDWNLNNYFFQLSDNKSIRGAFYAVDRHGTTYEKITPMEQVAYYKDKLSLQLIPQVGEDFGQNSRHYGLIKTAVYFHKSTTAQAQALFKDEAKNFSFPIIGHDSLSKNNLSRIIPDVYRNQSYYWQKEWNKEILFWLKPPFHVVDKKNSLELNKDQLKFSKPQSGRYRVRGVAGSGKTQVLAYRASELASQGYRVLILTFNITLRHVIHDMVSKSPFAFNWGNLTITHFHGFCKDILNEFGEKWPADRKDEDIFKNVVPKMVLESIQREEYYDKYDAILIDEGQDFCVEWYSMICRFLTSRDELVVVRDKKQNIYDVSTEWIDSRRKGVGKFEDWIELKKIIRLPEKIAKISLDFSKIFNLSQEIKIIHIEKSDLFNQFHDHVVWWNIEHDWLSEVDRAFEIIKSQATYPHISDTVILLPYNDWGFACVQHFETKKNIKVIHTFEKQDDKRRHKHKSSFRMESGRLKMSTIQSFKGWEVPNVIVVIPPFFLNQEEIYDRHVYTALTRAKENLIVINAHKRYWNFGDGISNEWSY